MEDDVAYNWFSNGNSTHFDCVESHTGYFVARYIYIHILIKCGKEHPLKMVTFVAQNKNFVGKCVVYYVWVLGKKTIAVRTIVIILLFKYLIIAWPWAPHMSQH